jgi:hypothetical protein
MSRPTHRDVARNHTMEAHASLDGPSAPRQPSLRRAAVNGDRRRCDGRVGVALLPGWDTVEDALRGVLPCGQWKAFEVA